MATRTRASSSGPSYPPSCVLRPEQPAVSQTQHVPDMTTQTRASSSNVRVAGNPSHSPTRAGPRPPEVDTVRSLLQERDVLKGQVIDSFRTVTRSRASLDREELQRFSSDFCDRTRISKQVLDGMEAEFECFDFSGT